MLVVVPSAREVVASLVNHSLRAGQAAAAVRERHSRTVFPLGGSGARTASAGPAEQRRPRDGDGDVAQPAPCGTRRRPVPDGRRPLRPPARRLPHAGNARSARTLPLPRRLADGQGDICQAHRCAGGRVRSTRITRAEVDARNRYAPVPASHRRGVLQRRPSSEAAAALRVSQRRRRSSTRSSGFCTPELAAHRTAAARAGPVLDGRAPWSEAPQCGAVLDQPRDGGAGKRAARFLAASSVPVIRVAPDYHRRIGAPGVCRPPASLLAAAASEARVRARTVFPPRGIGARTASAGPAKQRRRSQSSVVGRWIAVVGSVGARNRSPRVPPFDVAQGVPSVVAGRLRTAGVLQRRPPAPLAHNARELRRALIAAGAPVRRSSGSSRARARGSARAGRPGRARRPSPAPGRPSPSRRRADGSAPSLPSCTSSRRCAGRRRRR